MTAGNQRTPEHNQTDHPRYIMRRIVIVMVIIAVGIVVTLLLIKSKPKVSKRQPERIAPLVKVVSMQPGSQAIRIKAMGTVTPSREIVLKTPVGGEIIHVNSEFSPGGLFQENTTILNIDPRDYELALQQKERVLSDAEYAYKLEEGRQDVARQEWNLLRKDGDVNEIESDLALRKPHLEKVQVDIKAARADLELAKLNLSRTKVSAPFNCLVLNKYVDQGAFVAPQEKLADLVGTDEYWVQVSVPLNRLKWLKIPKQGETGSTASIYYRNTIREGQVIRLQGDLTKEGRMARLLVSVHDPLGLSASEEELHPLVIGEYVRVEIEGEELQDVYKIPRTALRNDREIWVATKEERLSIRPVNILWREESHVLVNKSLQPGEFLIVSDLPVPVEGMMVRIEKHEGQ